MVTVGNSGAIWRGAGGLTLSRSRRPFRTAYLRFIIIELRFQPALGPLCARCSMNQCFVLFAGSEQSMCNDADIIYSSQTELAGCDEWQSVNAMSLKDVQLVFPFFVLCLFYHFKWQTVSNLFIFLCCTFHCVNSKMLNEFSVLTRLIKYILG